MSVNLSYESKDREKEEELPSNKIRNSNKISTISTIDEKHKEKIITVISISENYQAFMSIIFFFMGCIFLFYLFSFVFSIYVSFQN